MRISRNIQRTSIVIIVLTFVHRLGSMNVNISIPIHLRYHKAAKKEKFVPVSLSPPTILGKCNHGKCIIIQTAA